jgi:isocitrate dehydrogenase
MMLDYLGWKKAADRIRKGLAEAVANKRVTYDLARQMEGAVEVKCSEFAEEIVRYL